MSGRRAPLIRTSLAIWTAVGCLTALLLLVYSRGTSNMEVYQDWTLVEVDDKFSLRLPASLTKRGTRPIDSDTRRWEGPDLIVHSDYGRFSDPLTTYSRKKSHRAETASIGGDQATIVSFEQDNGWLFTAVHFPNLGEDAFGGILKLTLVVESSPEVDPGVPMRIVTSVRF
jgi:hypothetical protein